MVRRHPKSNTRKQQQKQGSNSKMSNQPDRSELSLEDDDDDSIAADFSTTGSMPSSSTFIQDAEQEPRGKQFI